MGWELLCKFVAASRNKILPEIVCTFNTVRHQGCDIRESSRAELHTATFLKLIILVCFLFTFSTVPLFILVLVHFCFILGIFPFLLPYFGRCLYGA